MRARLIIKGNKIEATKAAADRGFPFRIDPKHGGHVETVGLTWSTAERLNQWFTEHTDPPFPVGSLLLWTPIGE